MSGALSSIPWRSARTSVLLVVVVTMLLAVSADAQQPPPKPPDTKADDAKATTVVYKPPLRGSPGGRVGGGTRGTGREAFVLYVLAPNHTGLTTSEEPSLFWFISSESSYPVELTLVDPDKTDPLLEVSMKPPVKAGFHRFRLGEHKARLTPGKAYQWYVAVVPDGARRSKDILAGGMIEAVSAPDGLSAKAAKTPRADLPSLFADAGFWYDAMTALGDLIDQAPTDRALLDQRSALLRQIGLPDVTASQ